MPNRTAELLPLLKDLDEIKARLAEVDDFADEVHRHIRRSLEAMEPEAVAVMLKGFCDPREFLEYPEILNIRLSQ